MLLCMYLQGPGITQGDVSVWQCLPDEILLLIFSYLSQQELARSSRVCQQFQRVATDKSLCKELFYIFWLFM